MVKGATPSSLATGSRIMRGSWVSRSIRSNHVGCCREAKRAWAHSNHGAKGKGHHDDGSSLEVSGSSVVPPLSPALENASDIAFDEPNDGYES
jgi:hypothetical protein